MVINPLIITEHLLYLKLKKLLKNWSKYIKGALAVFMLYILKGKKIIVLSLPPLYRLYLSRLINY